MLQLLGFCSIAELYPVFEAVLSRRFGTRNAVRCAGYRFHAATNGYYATTYVIIVEGKVWYKEAYGFFRLLRICLTDKAIACRYDIRGRRFKVYYDDGSVYNIYPSAYIKCDPEPCPMIHLSLDSEVLGYCYDVSTRDNRAKSVITTIYRDSIISVGDFIHSDYWIPVKLNKMHWYCSIVDRLCVKKYSTP
jgi:hypothetical protein